MANEIQGIAPPTQGRGAPEVAGGGLGQEYTGIISLGKSVKEKNPSLSGLSDFAVGKAYKLKFPDTKVKYGLDRRSFVDKGIAAGFGVVDDFMNGMVNGATFGLTGGIQSLAGMEPEGMAYGAGNIVGEIAGPYRFLRKFLLGKAPVKAMLEKAPRMGLAGLSGIESGVVEGTKGAVRFDDPVGHLATGLVVGVLPEGMFRLGGKLVRYGGRKLAKAKPGEIDEVTMKLFEKHDIPGDPAIFRPDSPVVNYAQRRVHHTVATRKILLTRRRKMAEKIEDLRRKVSIGFGDNTTLRSPLEVGRSVMGAIDETLESLKADGKGLYEELKNTDIGKIDIDHDMKFQRILGEGEEEIAFETGLISGLKTIVKGENTALTPGPLKTLRTFIRQLEAATKAPPKTPAKYSDIGVNAGASPSIGGGEPVYQTYGWWWDKLQSVGEKYASPTVQHNPKMKAKYARVYAHIQDAIDAQAASVDPAYDESIRHARSAWSSYRTFEENPLVKRLTSISDRDPEKIMTEVFSSQNNVQEFKKLVGPEAFNGARQAWIRDLLWDAVVNDAETGIQYVSGAKITTKLSGHLEGTDSDFLREIFSDEGFMTPMGEHYPVKTQAKEKLELLMDLLHISQKTDTSLRMLKGGQEQFGAGVSAERISPAMLLQNIAEGGRQARGLVSNLLLMRKGADLYLEPPKTNIFLGGKGDVPEVGDMMWRVPHTGQDVAKSSILSSGINQLIGSVDGAVRGNDR